MKLDLLQRFNLKNNKRPQKRGLYAVETGAYIGQMLVYCETKGKNHIFLSLPKMTVLEIEETVFESGISNKIVNFVRKLPGSVYMVCKEQYEAVKHTVAPKLK